MLDAGSAVVLVVDDQPANVRVLISALEPHGYRIESAFNGADAIESIERRQPDIVLLDVVMPSMSGLEVCRRLRADPRHASLPIVLVTALDPDTERVRGLEAGADDFLSKPINGPELIARVRSLVRVKRLFDRTEAQARQLQMLNEALEERVAQKVGEVQRLSRLKRFVSPQLAERIIAGAEHDPLQSHRRDIAVVFFDLRGFTAFAEAAEPEDVMRLLAEFHRAVGAAVLRFGGTVERFAGDGVMIFFNDPEPVEAPCAVAALFARAVLMDCAAFLARWRAGGFSIDMGAGIAYGYATLGAIGFADRVDYGAIGSVTNLAARLCSEARGGEMLISTRVASALPGQFRIEPAGPFNLKGFRDPVGAFRLIGADERESAS